MPDMASDVSGLVCDVFISFRPVGLQTRLIRLVVVGPFEFCSKHIVINDPQESAAARADMPNITALQQLVLRFIIVFAGYAQHQGPSLALHFIMMFPIHARFSHKP